MKPGLIRATMSAVRESGIPFGSYLLLRRLARGGMAEVFLARQRGPGGFERRVAVKRILPHLVDSEDFVHMFLDEARLAARLSHPNIVHIYEFGKVDEHYFIAMEYVDGVHAGALIERGPANRVPPALVARIGADACTGLNYAHHAEDESGRLLHLVHRDISPPNLMISFDGAVKLVDFGIAKAVSSVERTRPGVVKGKFAYMSPEQTMNKRLNDRSDVFSLGIILWELLAGRVAVSRDDPVFAMESIRDGKVPPIRSVSPEVPPLLSDVIDMALCVRPEDRPSAAEFGSALEGFIKSSPELGTSLQLSQWIRRRFRQGSGPLPAMDEVAARMQAAIPGAGRAPVAPPPASPSAFTPTPMRGSGPILPAQIPIPAPPPTASPGRDRAPRPSRPSTPATVVAALHSASEPSAAEEVTERTQPPRMSTPTAPALLFTLPEQADEATERTAPPDLPKPGRAPAPAQWQSGPAQWQSGPAQQQPGPAQQQPGPVQQPAYPRIEPARRPSSISLPRLASDKGDDITDPITEVVRDPPYARNMPDLALERGASIGAWTGPYDRRRRGRRIAITAVLTILMVAALMLSLTMLRDRSPRDDAESGGIRPAELAAEANEERTAPPATPVGGPAEPAPALAIGAIPADAAVPVVPPADEATPAAAGADVDANAGTAPAPATATDSTAAGIANQAAPLPVKAAPVKHAPAGDGRAQPREATASGAAEQGTSGGSPARRGNGRLTVVTQPYSNVYSGKTKLGTTPLAELTMPVGEHVLTFRSPGYPAVTRRVVIRPGRTTKLKFSLTEAK